MADSSTARRPPTTALRSTRFVSFLIVQFLGAANDNAFKMTLTMYVLRVVTDESLQLRYNAVATLLFPLPFLLFSPLAGVLADRVRKDRVVLLTKIPEVVAMALAVAAFASGNLAFLLAVLFLMATQSALFGPAKYGLLPESIAPRDLSMANGVLETTTNLAILTGSLLGVVVFGLFEDDLARAGWVYLAVAVVGAAAAAHVPRTPPGNPSAPLTWNAVAAGRAAWKVARELPVLRRTLLGIAYFGFLGSVFLAVVPVFGRSRLGLSEQGAGTLLMILSVGIAAGSLTAGRLSSGRVEIGLVPIGSVGLTLFSLDLALFGAGGFRVGGDLTIRTVVDLSGIGASAGLYIVPLNALLQQRSPEGMKGRLIAFSNILTFSAVFASGVLSLVLTDLAGFDAAGVILVMAGLTAVATLYILYLLPDAFVRLVLWTLTHTVYRIEPEGEDNLPRAGALIVANHVSWVDALLIGASCDRMIRFLMYRPYYDTPGLRWFFRRMHAIPVMAGDTPEQRTASLDIARGQIELGHLVCIFAEGAITRTGNLLKFKRGFERIADHSGAPIVPVYLGGVWGSLFSWERGRLLFKRPRRLRDPVRVVFGAPMPATSKAFEVRGRIQELSVRAFESGKGERRTLADEFVHTAKRFWSRPIASDGSGTELGFGEALVRALALRDACLDRPGRGDEPVGVLLPPGIPGLLANLAVVASGRPVVNLDADRGAAWLRGEIEHAGIRQVLSSRGRPAAEAPEGTEIIDVEEVLGRIPAATLVALRLRCRLLPASSLSRRRLPPPARLDVDRTAALVFSFAPHLDGALAAAELTHDNIRSNLESLKQVFRLSRGDRILGLLPLATSYGLFGTVFLPAIAGIPVVYAGFDDVDALVRTAERYRPTVLPASAADLALLVDASPPEPFDRLRHVVVAGAGLRRDLLDRFAARFGVEPLVGFGAAECAPLVSLNVPTPVRGPRGQHALRPGTVGQPLPGIAVRILDRDTGGSLPPGDVGDLEVKGPNVMRGYYRDPERTAAVLRDGWYRTGFRASEDADGFLDLEVTTTQPPGYSGDR